jgi:hypothetical protein
MRIHSTKTVLATSVIGAALALAAPDAAAQGSAPFKTTQQFAMEKARDQGTEAVRRYIHRTRMIYALTWADFYVID